MKSYHELKEAVMLCRADKRGIRNIYVYSVYKTYFMLYMYRYIIHTVSLAVQLSVAFPSTTLAQSQLINSTLTAQLEL